MLVTGTPGRWRTSSATGCRCWSHPTPGCAKTSGPAGTRAPTRSCEPCSQATLGHELYKHRKATVEPVFAQNKFNRGFRRFQRRGRAAVRSEWRLQAAVHNLLKLHNHWINPATGLTPARPRPRSRRSVTRSGAAFRIFARQPPPNPGATSPLSARLVRPSDERDLSRPREILSHRGEIPLVATW